MLPESFLLNYVGFSADNAPIIDVQVDDELSRIEPLGRELSLEFDMTQRFCTGWLDFANHQALPCPDHAIVEGKYDQCITCRNKTGFNPAFYNAASVSDQQQVINRNPHFLYLAYFAPGLVKVGISQEARGIRRLLEQGARIALKLETFPSAEIARQYEAKIAAMDGIVEHVVGRKKLDTLSVAFDEASAVAELQRVVARITAEIGVAFDRAEIVRTAPWFHSGAIDLAKAVIMRDQPCIVGTVRAVIGHTILLEHTDRLLAYDIKKFTGYRAKVDTGVEVELPSEQLTLF